MKINLMHLIQLVKILGLTSHTISSGVETLLLEVPHDLNISTGTSEYIVLKD